MKRLSLIGAIAAVIGALVLAGCGGSSGGGSTETSTTAGAEGATAGGGAKLEISSEARACLKEKGVELPEFKGGEGGAPMGENGEAPEGFEPPEGGELPGGGEAPEGGAMPEGGPPTGAGGGAMSEENKEAFEECGVETPEFKGGPGGGGGPKINSAAFKKQVKEYVACVRENGYELPEPNFSGEGPIFEKSESESSAFKQASEQCQSLLGGPQTGTSASSTEET
jgi:hypothetical protein